VTDRLVEEIHPGGILEIRLRLNEANTLDRDAAKRLAEALDKHKESPNLHAIALTAEGRFFSNGMDPLALIGKSEAEIRETMSEVLLASAALYFFPLPVFAVLQGHCIGAAAIFALYCDYRFSADSKARFGFPEVELHMNLPSFTAILLEEMIGPLRARECLYRGQFIKPEEAKSMGLIDGFFSAQTLREEAFRQMAYLSEVPPEALKRVKASLRSHKRALWDSLYPTDLETTVANILSPESQSAFIALSNRQIRH
jgi:enoyl-CoA hydratase/carnithine racemase